MFDFLLLLGPAVSWTASQYTGIYYHAQQAYDSNDVIIRHLMFFFAL